MNNLGQSFIFGTKNGSPAWFDIKTGGTTVGFGKKQASKKRRRGADQKEAATTKTSDHSTWIKGCKDGKVCYFNVETKEWRHTPPSKLPGVNVTTIDVANNLDVPTAIPFDIEPIDIGTDIGKAESDHVEAEEFFRLVLEEEEEGRSDMMVDEDAVVKSEFTVSKTEAINKEDDKKLKNREYANKSRKRNKARLKAAEERVEQLEKQLRDLREQLSVRNAENEALRNHISFLQPLVRDKIKASESRE